MRICSKILLTLSAPEMNSIMKKLLSLVLLATVMFACEEGVVITVPAGSSYAFDMNANAVNSAQNNQTTVSQTVDVTTLVDEDSEQIESIKLDKLTYELSGYNNTSGDVVLMDLTISTKLNDTENPIMSLSGLVVENTGVVLAFEDCYPSSSLRVAWELTASIAQPTTGGG